VLVLRCSVEDADPRLNTDARFSAGDANALAAFCLALFGFWLSASVAVLLVSRALRWSRLLSLRFAWCCMVLGWSLAVCAVLCGFMYFALVSAALAAFGLVLYGFGLVFAGFAVLYGFMYFVLVSAALAAFFWFWAGLCQFRCFVLVLRCSVEDADPRLNTDAKFSAGDANPTPSANNINIYVG
jgi:hypothetical protein